MWLYNIQCNPLTVSSLLKWLVWPWQPNYQTITSTAWDDHAEGWSWCPPIDLETSISTTSLPYPSLHQMGMKRIWISCRPSGNYSPQFQASATNRDKMAEDRSPKPESHMLPSSENQRTGHRRRPWSKQTRDISCWRLTLISLIAPVLEVAAAQRLLHAK